MPSLRKRCWSFACAVLLAAIGAPIGTGGRADAASSDRQIVSLGDSYSSGEGIQPFDSGTDEGADRCHRSAKAWPRLVGVTRATHIACSGARIPDMFEGQIAGRSGTDSVGQIARLRVIARDGGVSAVTVTLGGNDVGFKDILTHCFAAVTACLKHPEVERGRINAVTTDLRDRVYPAIRAAAGPAIPIVVVGYPRLMPESSDQVVNCRAWLSESEQRAINNLQDDFDDSLRDAVADTSVDDIGFVSVLDTSSGHELCGDDPWFRAVSAKDCKFNGNRTTRAKCAHPTPPLHRAIAARVASALPGGAPAQGRTVHGNSELTFRRRVEHSFVDLSGYEWHFVAEVAFTTPWKVDVGPFDPLRLGPEFATPAEAEVRAGSLLRSEVTRVTGPTGMLTWPLNARLVVRLPDGTGEFTGTSCGTEWGVAGWGEFRVDERGRYPAFIERGGSERARWTRTGQDGVLALCSRPMADAIVTQWPRPVEAIVIRLYLSTVDERGGVYTFRFDADGNFLGAE